MSKNDITGDTLTSKPSSIEFRANYDAIFRKHKYGTEEKDVNPPLVNSDSKIEANDVNREE